MWCDYWNSSPLTNHSTLADYFLLNASQYLSPRQALYVAGAFENDIADTVWFVSQSNNPQPNPAFSAMPKKLIHAYVYM